MAKQWHFQGDINFLDYGGKWVRQIKGTRRFHIVDITNMDEACGRDNEGYPKYCVELNEVDLDALTPENLKRVESSCGPWDEDISDLWIAEACHGYGLKSPLEQWSGNAGMAMLRKARSESKRLEADSDAYAYEERMERPVNAIGSTAREYGRGDIDSALTRGIATGDPTAKLMGKLHGLED